MIVGELLFIILIMLVVPYSFQPLAFSIVQLSSLLAELSGRSNENPSHGSVADSDVKVVPLAIRVPLTEI